MGGDLVALQVVVPLLAAPILALVRRREWSHYLAVGVTFVTFGISLVLVQRVLEAGVLSYPMGGWATSVGIEYRVDQLTAFVLALVSGVGPLMRKALLERFATPAAVLRATRNELREVQGVGPKLAAKIAATLVVPES